MMLKRMVSPAAKRKGVQYYLSALTRCSVTNRLCNTVFLHQPSGLAVVAVDQEAANRWTPPVQT